MTTPRPVPCVGVVCLRGSQVLLIQRGKQPRVGEWSIPGGRMEIGETVVAAGLRELAEETGVEADMLGLLDVVDHISDHGHMVLSDYAARWRGGEPLACDDAADAAFVDIEEACQRVSWSETERIIRLAVERFGS